MHSGVVVDRFKMGQQCVEVVIRQTVSLRGAAQGEGGHSASDIEEGSAFSHSL
jgi:hypothetical protein